MVDEFQRRREDRAWEELRKKVWNRHHSKRKYWKIIIPSALLLLVAFACGFGVYAVKNQIFPLTLPPAVMTRTLILSDSEEPNPADFVTGLEGTGIHVSLGAGYDPDKMGQQKVSLILRKGLRSCTVKAQLYRFHLRQELTVELGEETQVDVRSFVRDSNVPASLLTPLEEGKAGTFTLELLCDSQKYTVQCTVKEDIPPQAISKELDVEAGSLPNPEDFLVEIVDHSQVTVTYKEIPQFPMLGKQTVTLVLTDFFGNTAEEEVTANVVSAKDGPHFEGLTDIYLEIGTTVSYKTGVKVTDAQDGELAFTVDSGNFDNKTVGEYIVMYSATDSDGNTLLAPRKIVVESHIGQIVREEAQKLLDKLIKPGMGRDEQIRVISQYVRNNVWYSGNSDKSSVENGAYEGFTKWSGDCYTYYAMFKVMMDLLDIPNLEVRRVGGTSNHWWNLVQFEDGKYYHVDPSQHPGSELNHSKMTESDLEYYTEKRSTGKDKRPNYYVYDHTLPEYQGLDIAQ